MHDSSVYTIAQDEKSCVVCGKPAVVVKKGGVGKILHLEYIAAELINRCSCSAQYKAKTN